MLEIPRKEIYRYLGYHGVAPSTEVEALVGRCVAHLQEVIEPRAIHAVFPLEISPDGMLSFGGMRVSSQSLLKNLDGCVEVCMMAATIGVGVDRLIRQAEVRQMSQAVIYQAAGAAAVEELCDQHNAEIAAEAQTRGLACRPRFSPGYGDFALEHQRQFLQILNASKRIGVCLSDSLLMTPSKSVTAVIGLCKENSTSTIDPGLEAEPGHACQHCGCPDCQFRA
ncbi:MAG: hypothetical protein IKS83_09495 [Victivallales bacterium]|nr:hypothetical protein [Victivallales bacterium]